MARRAALLLCVLALCASCQKFAEGRIVFRELLTLRDEIATEFKEKVVDVNIANGDRLTVKFVNSRRELRGPRRELIHPSNGSDGASGEYV